MTPTPPELLQGTVDILILRALTRSEMHGYAISHWLEERSEGVLAVEGAALYQALHRIERKGWVSASWGLSENNRKAKFYALTPAGKAHLKSNAAEWTRYVEAVFKVLAPV